VDVGKAVIITKQTQRLREKHWDSVDSTAKSS